MSVIPFNDQKVVARKWPNGETLFEIEVAQKIERHAVISNCGQYRYTLYRQWDDGRHVTFLMFNPSTADANVDDHTIRKCMGFAKRWGYARLSVVNLFALRSSDPRAVRRSTDPIGPLNDYWIDKVFAETREVICAWGCEQHAKGDIVARRVVKMIRMASAHYLHLECLGTTKTGVPRHPLMLPYETSRSPWPEPEATA